MGCCFSSAKKQETAKRLAQLEEQISAAGDSGTDDLSSLGGCAEELRGMFNKIANADAKDMQSINKIQELSGMILHKLLPRIPALAKQEESVYQPVFDSIMKIGDDLNAVRATKATVAIEKKLQDELATIAAAKERSAKPKVERMKQLLTKLQASPVAGHILPATNDLLKVAEEAHSTAPDSKTVIAEVMHPLQDLAGWILNVEALWLESPEFIKQVVEASTSIDETARKLVAALGATWDPPITPQVERMRDAKAEKLMKGSLEQAETCLAAEDAGTAYNHLEALLPWWPLLQSSHSLEVVGMFSKLQTYTSEAFLKATKEGDPATAEAIRGFAAEFDAGRQKFEGLPPTASARPLGEVLEVGAATVEVLKAFDIIDAELAKTKDDDASTNLSLGTTIQALERLVNAWPTASKKSTEELMARMATSCSNLEQWTIESGKVCSAAKIGGLLKFAAEYDSRRSKLEPASSGLLKPKIASEAALKHLRLAKAELDKATGMNASLLLDSLKAAAEAIPGETGTEEARSELLEVFTATEERLLKAFVETISSTEVNEKKEVMLLKFAEGADAVRDISTVTVGDGSKLVDRMRKKRADLGEEYLAKLEAQLGPEADFKAAAQLLVALVPISKKLTEDEDHWTRLKAVCPGLAELLVQATIECQSGEAADALMQSARDIDRAVLGLGLDAIGLGDQVVEHVVQAHIDAADRATADAGKLRAELAALEGLCRNEKCSAEVLAAVQKFAGSLETPLAEQLLQEGSDQAAAILEAGEFADKVCAAAGGPKSGIAAKLEKAQTVAQKLAAAQAELDKPTGMNVKTVLNALKGLEAAWGAVARSEACSQRLQEIFYRFKDKLVDACRKAYEAEAEVREKKIQAVQQLAKEGDEAQRALVALSSGLLHAESYVEAVSRCSAEKSLEVTESELAKASGMSTETLMIGIRGFVKELQSAGGASKHDAGFEEVGSLKDRFAEVCHQVATRMKSSMDDAVSAANKGKQSALIKFAKDFDAACADLAVVSLEEDLQGKISSV